ncbi:glycosyltransferase family 2 protein [bacterium]|nr:glycosyltransferase family 2 protein [bacterium]
MPNLVSIIIPCYNQSAYVAHAVESALAQTFRDFEVILVDDGSTDQTPQILAKFQAGNPDRISIVSQSNQGLSMARQAGLDRAPGEYIVFLDSDDWLMPGMLGACLAGFRRRPRASVIVGRTMVVYENKPDQTRILSPGKNARWPDVLAVNPFGHPCSMMLRKTAILEAGGVGMPGVRSCEDWDLYARMLRRGMIFECIPDVLAAYYQHENVLSRDIESMLQAKLTLLDRQTEDVSGDVRDQCKSYRNGHVLFAFGQAVGRQYDLAALSGIIDQTVRSAMQFRYFCNQFLYGLQHSIALTHAKLGEKYIDQACRLAFDRFGALGFGRHARMFTREMRREMRDPMRRYSISRRLSRLLDPARKFIAG